MKWKPFVFSLTLATVLFLACLIGYIEILSVPVRRFTVPLREAVPFRLDGWGVTDVPLAETQGMMQNVNEILQYDDVVQRAYRKGPLEILVYAAYWKPGKVTISDAGTHNPDSCWVLAGWDRRDRRYAVDQSIGGHPMLPCEYGVYSLRGRDAYVNFWHLVNGEPNRYEDQKTGWRTGFEGRLERLPLLLADMRRHGVNMKREQLFVRISANLPYEHFRDDVDYVRLMNALRPLGLFKETESNSSTR